MHVIVIGAGAFGTWTARWLLRRGARVTLVDQYGAGNSLASSGDESRVTRSAHGPDAFYPVWQRRALGQWRDLDPGLVVETGVVWLAGEGDAIEAASAETLARLGIPVERLDLDELTRRHPTFATDDLAWALWEPEGGAILARRAVAAAARAVAAEGGEVRIGHASFDPHTGGVEVDGEPQACDAVVLAAGPWLGRLLGPDVALRLSVPRQEVVYFATPPGDDRFDATHHPTWVDYGGAIYGIPSVERRGFKVAPDRPGPPADPDREDRRLSRERVDEARAYLRRRFPDLADQPVAEGRVCQYEMTPDAHFVIDRHPTVAGAWIVGGGSGHGFKHGPVVGEYVSALVLGDDAAAGELAPPDDRFRLRERTAGGAGLRTSAADAAAGS